MYIYLSIINILVVVLVAANIVSADQGDSAIEAAIQINDTEIIIGEPLLCKCTIRNTRKTPIALGSTYAFGYSDPASGANRSSIMISVGDEKSYKAWDPSLDVSNRGFMGDNELKTRKTYSEKFVVVAKNTGKLFFDNSETYYIKGEFLVKRNTETYPVHTNEHVLRVKPPTKKVDKEAWHEIKKIKRSYINVIQAPWWIGGIQKKKWKKLHGIAIEHQKSTYSPYLLFSLARHYKTLARSISSSSKEKAKQYKARALAILVIAQNRSNNAMLAKFIRDEIKTVAWMFPEKGWLDP